MSCKIAKRISELPYRYSNIERTKKQFKSSNLEYNDKLNIEYTIGKELKEKTKLDKWLTERYALFQDSTKSINEFEIHHLEWPINEIQLEVVDLEYQRFNNLINDEPNKVQYSTGVKVIAWEKIKKAKKGYNK